MYFEPGFHMGCRARTRGTTSSGTLDHIRRSFPAASSPLPSGRTRGRASSYPLRSPLYNGIKDTYESTQRRRSQGCVAENKEKSPAIVAKLFSFISAIYRLLTFSSRIRPYLPCPAYRHPYPATMAVFLLLRNIGNDNFGCQEHR